MTDYFNPSSRTNLPTNLKKIGIQSFIDKSPVIYCSCGFRVIYDSNTDVFGCPHCGFRFTSQGLIDLLKKRFK